jgi:hypothetical protein
MSDNLRRYRAIRDALAQCYPTTFQGNFARHLNTLAALISGIVGSKSTQLPHIATKVPDGTKPESRVKRFTRWLDNDHILEEMYFLPSADVLLRHLALQTVGSYLRRDNVVSVLYSEGLNSTKSSVFLQRADRHGIVGQKSSDFQRFL